MTMVERVAGAIAGAAFQSDQIPPISIGKEAALVIARAAIKAMRELSPAAQGAGAHQMVTHNHCAGVAMIYAAIIDAALAEEAPATP